MDKVICSSCQNESMEIVQSRIAADVYECSSCGQVKIWGPCCGQGWVLPFRIIKLDKIVFSCVECDALWFDVTSIGNQELEPNTNMTAYLEEHGIRPMPNEVEVMQFTSDLKPIPISPEPQKDE